MRRRCCALAILGLVALACGGCSLADTSGYKSGELGNGGFYFSCNDAVSCSRYSDDAAKFPQAVALGSSFQVRFVSRGADTPDRGLTINPVGEYISRGPNGLVALKSGYGTITSRDASGRLVDFVNIRVAKPDTLIVYAADDLADAPSRVDSVALGKGESRSFRAFAEEQKKVLAGSRSPWT